jgi:hypothetical protein
VELALRLREERGMKPFENCELRRLFGTEKVEARRGW